MTPQKLLTGLLGVQVLLAAITWWPSNDGNETLDLVPFESSAVTKVRIESATTKSRGDGLVLARKGEGWVIESEYGYPADTAKVDELLEKLDKITVRKPIATQAVRHEQLNVSDDNATRRVTVTAGDQTASFVLGIAGSTRSHVRKADGVEVYQVNGLGAWAIRDTSGMYLERKILDVQPGDLEAYTLTNGNGVVELVRGPDNAWTSPALADGQALDPAKVSKLFTETLQLSMTSPADPSLDPFARDGASIVRWSHKVDGQSVPNAVAIYSEDEVGYVRVEDQALPVKLGSITTQKTFADTTLDRLLVGAVEEKPIVP